MFACFCDTGTLFSTTVSVQRHPQVSYGLTLGSLWPSWGRFGCFGVPSVFLSMFFWSLLLLREGSGLPCALLWGTFGVTLGSLWALWGNLGLPGLPAGAKDAQKHVFLRGIGVCTCGRHTKTRQIRRMCMKHAKTRVFTYLMQMRLIARVFVCFSKGPKSRERRRSEKTRVFMGFYVFGRFRGQSSLGPKHTCFCVFLSRMSLAVARFYVFVRGF